MHSSDSADYKNTGGDKSAPEKPCNSHTKQTRTISELNFSDAYQVVEDWPIRPGTEQDDGEIFNSEESCLARFSLNGYGSNVIETIEEVDQIKAFNNLSLAFQQLRLSLSEQVCNDLLSVLNKNAKHAERFFIQHHKTS